MRNIAIREDDLIHRMFREQPKKFLFGVDANPIGIMGSG
jgi:hypothetical protein